MKNGFFQCRMIVFLIFSFSVLWGRGAFSQCTVPDECDPSKVPALTTSDRVAAMKTCLGKVASPMPKGSKFFTYGHPDKMKALNTKSKDVSWAVTTAFQNRREIRQAIKTESRFSDPKVIKRAKEFTSSTAFHDLEDLLGQYMDFRDKKKDAEIKKDQIALKDLETEYFAIRLAAFSKIYTNIIDDIENDTSTSSKIDLKIQAINLKPSSTAQDYLDLEALKATKIANLVDPGFDSTGGFGNYLAENSTQSIEHIYGAGNGLSCDAPGGNIVINTEDACVKEILVKARILVPDLRKRVTDANVLRPQKKNIYVSPQDFEKAAEGFVVAFRPAKLTKNDPPYYVDKKAMDFSTCTPVSWKDFSSCNDFNGLLFNSRGMGIPEFLRNENKFEETLLNLIKKCMGDCTAPENIETSVQFTRHFTSSNLKQFFKDNEKELTDLYSQCGCFNATLKEKKFPPPFIEKAKSGQTVLDLAKTCIGDCNQQGEKDFLKNLSEGLSSPDLNQFFQTNKAEFNKVFNKCGCEFARPAKLGVSIFGNAIFGRKNQFICNVKLGCKTAQRTKVTLDNLNNFHNSIKAVLDGL